MTVAGPDSNRGSNGLAESLIHHAHDVLLLLDGQGRILEASDSALTVMGHEPASVLGTTIFEHVHPDDLSYGIGAISQASGASDHFPPIEIRGRHASGHWVHLEVSSSSFTAEDGSARILAILRDLQDRSLLASRRQEFESLLISLGSEVAAAEAETYDAMANRALGGMARILNPAVATLSLRTARGWEVRHRWVDPRSSTDTASGPTSPDPDPGMVRFEQATEGRDAVLALVVEDGDLAARLDLRWDGAARRWGDVHAHLVRAVVSILLAGRRRIEREIDLSHRALHDPLTGLANRTRFLAELDAAIKRHELGRSGGIMVAFCDLDGFKAVNDRFGHATGDELLCALADRLRSVTRTNTTVGRLSGDEFALVCDQVPSPIAAQAVAARVAEALGRPFEARNGVVSVSGSVGVCWVGEHVAPPTAPELLADADAAMYRAKRAGRGRIEFVAADHRTP